MDKDIVRISKFLSFVLRHRPEVIGLSLDENGWARIEELLDKAGRSGRPLTRKALQEVVDRNDKQRFSMSDDGLLIRASQGHSIPLDLQLKPAEPPEMLYHGTARRYLESIRRHGLLPKGRRHVHLSPDETTTAIRVGKRHGKPVVLGIQAGRMHAAGYTFYLSANGVWLTEKVPAEFIG